MGGFGNVTKSGKLGTKTKTSGGGAGASGGFDATTWHTLELTLTETYTAGAVDGEALFNVSSSDGSAGYVGLSTSCEKTIAVAIDADFICNLGSE